MQKEVSSSFDRVIKEVRDVLSRAVSLNQRVCKVAVVDSGSGPICAVSVPNEIKLQCNWGCTVCIT